MYLQLNTLILDFILCTYHLGFIIPWHSHNIIKWDKYSHAYHLKCFGSSSTLPDIPCLLCSLYCDQLEFGNHGSQCPIKTRLILTKQSIINIFQVTILFITQGSPVSSKVGKNMFFFFPHGFFCLEETISSSVFH